MSRRYRSSPIRKHDRFPDRSKNVDARFILNSFQNRAMDISMKNDFKRVANNLFGEDSFDVCVDLTTKRMYFFCLVCKKDMNNEKSLQEHAQSGMHLKRISETDRSSRSSYRHHTSRYKSNSISQDLHAKLNECRVEILGLQLMEQYVNRSGKSYYMCTLCHSHGKLEDVVKHFIGDKHTDRYIRITVVLRCSDITAEERTFLRKAIFEHQRFTEKDVVRYTDPRMYPYILENELRSNSKRKRNHGYSSPSCSNKPSAYVDNFDMDENDELFIKIKSPSPRFSVSPMHMDISKIIGDYKCSPSYSSDNSPVDMDLDSDSGDFCASAKLLEQFSNPSPPHIKLEEGLDEEKVCSKVAIAIQTGDDYEEKFQHFLANIQALTVTHGRESRLTTHEDLRVCLTLTFACLHVVFFSTYRDIEKRKEIILKNEDERQYSKLSVIKTCFGYLKHRFQTLLNEKYDMDLDLAQKEHRRQWS